MVKLSKKRKTSTKNKAKKTKKKQPDKKVKKIPEKKIKPLKLTKKTTVSANEEKLRAFSRRAQSVAARGTLEALRAPVEVEHRLLRRESVEAVWTVICVDIFDAVCGIGRT